MAKFKVGDRIRCINAGGQEWTTNGNTYVVDEATDGGTFVYFRGDEGRRVGRYADRFVLAAELEKGATVRLKDGVDEWEVRHVFDDGYVKMWRGNGKDSVFTTSKSDNVVVVKEKPEDPKPDYYVNCKGAEPKNGDVFTDDLSERQAYAVVGANYIIVGASTRVSYGTYPLSGPYRHSVGGGYAPVRRTLAIRDGKPYTG